MSPEPTPAPAQNKTVIYLLGVIVVLLVALVAIFVISRPAAAPTTTSTTPPASTTATGTGSMPGIKPSTGAAFDPATATAVDKGSTPEGHVKAYYQAILDKKWDVAFKMQPAASQQGGTVADFESTQTGYGLTAFKIVSAKAEGDTSVVEVEQNLGQNGTWGVQWTFVKYNGNWVVQSRQVQMK